LLTWYQMSHGKSCCKSRVDQSWSVSSCKFLDSSLPQRLLTCTPVSRLRLLLAAMVELLSSATCYRFGKQRLINRTLVPPTQAS
jgi:hypothetical protein